MVGFVAGALTEWSVPHLSFTLEPLSNTAGPWVFVAFAVALTARRMEEALVLAVVTFLGLVLGFYVAEAIRGWPVYRHQVVFWFVASFAAGPLVGLAADWLRRGGRVAGGIGAGILDLFGSVPALAASLAACTVVGLATLAAYQVT